MRQEQWQRKEQQVPQGAEGDDEATHGFSHHPGGNIGVPIRQDTQWWRQWRE